MKRWSFISRTARSMIQTCEIVIGISCEVWHELSPGGIFLSQVNLWFQTTCKINESMSCFQQVSVSLYFNDLFAYLFPALEPSSIACFFSGHREGRVSRVRPIFGFQNLFNFLHTLIRWGQQTTDLIGPTFGHHRPLSNLCLRVAMILQDLHEALQATKMCDVSKLMNSSFALVLFWPTFKLKLSWSLPFCHFQVDFVCGDESGKEALCNGGGGLLVRVVRRCAAWKKRIRNLSDMECRGVEPPPRPTAEPAEAVIEKLKFRPRISLRHVESRCGLETHWFMGFFDRNDVMSTLNLHLRSPKCQADILCADFLVQA